MWALLHKGKYILQAGDGCDPNVEECQPEIQAIECSDQCKAIEDRDKETAFPKDPPYTAKVCPMAQKNLQPTRHKLFNSILLRAWRKQREKIQNLKEKVEHQTRVTSKAKNELQIYKTLHRIEQKYNFQLKKLLESSVHHAEDVRGTCETLTTGLISLKADHSLMEQELKSKCRELNSLRLLLDESKADLFNSICEQETLGSTLDAERQRKKLLEAQKDQLIKEACELRVDKRKIKKTFFIKLEKKSKEVEEAATLIKHLEAQKKGELHAAKTNLESTAQLERKLKMARTQVVLLQRIIDGSLVARCTYYWGQFNRYKAHAVELIMSASVLLLPALPPPHKLSSMLN